MSKFIARNKEISQIGELINSNTFNSMLIYGRRRIGKTELIKHVLQKTSNDVLKIYYECKYTSEKNNVESLTDLISDFFDLPDVVFKDIEGILDFIFKSAQNKKIVLCLDEYSYLKSTIKGIDSILQSLVDKYKNTSKLTLILCGSYIDIMKSILKTDNPLYGRIDTSIYLTQMDYYESSQFYKNFNSEDKVKLYSVFGGIPYYNSLIKDKLSVKENIIRLIASPGARLQNEISMYLSSQISKTLNANEVFETLALGYSKYRDILDKSHVSSGPTLVDVLNKLIDMELVSKTVPINDKKNKRKTYYSICDNLSLFYYRYISRYASQMNIMSSNTFFDTYIKSDFEKFYVPKIFEDITSQYLIRQNMLDKINPPFEDIGKFYYDDPKNKQNGEFDVVTKDKLGYIFYESKFINRDITDKIIDEEIQQVEATNLKCYKYGFVAKKGFNLKKYKSSQNLILFNLKDMYNQ